MKPKVVILSPHLDDAVFSCWHWLSQPGAMVLTIFAGVPATGTHKLWDLLCGQHNSHTMMQTRQKENEETLQVRSVSVCNLNFLEAQYRKKTPSVEEIVAAVTKQVSGKNVIFLVPLAISKLYQHPDHVLIRQVGQALHKQGKSVVFFPDVPYMNSGKTPRDKQLQRLAKQASNTLGFNVTPHVYPLNNSALQAKRRAMHTYKTQYTMTNIVSLGGLWRVSKREYEVGLEPISSI